MAYTWPTSAAGPSQAQLVDADTKEPLEGAVVVAVWWKATRTLGGPSEEYHDSVELLTDPQGRFRVEARTFHSLNPLVFFRGPDFLIFKPGYGRAVWPGYETLPTAERRRVNQYAALLQRPKIVLEAPRLRTVDGRREYLKDVKSGFSAVPPASTPLLHQALEAERQAVGGGY
jgi:hypothetical protein